MKRISTPIHRFGQGTPEKEESRIKTWISRGSNFIIGYSIVETGAQITRGSNQRDEYMVFVLEGSVGIRLSEPDDEQFLDAGMLAIVPPGQSEINVIEPGRLIVIYSSRAKDIAALASNAQDFIETSRSLVAPLRDLSVPKGGYYLRVYDVESHSKEDSRMRVFRSMDLMVNIMKPRPAPRDTTMLSPHSHSDFEQGSLVLKGCWVHHLRHPWGSDYAQWREDEHIEVDGPSLLVIPPRVIHTSMNTSPGESWLIDVFAPPREDFCRRPGLVCNLSDYVDN